MSRREEVEKDIVWIESGGLDAEREQWPDLARTLADEVGCARGQRTTQFCADLERTMKERDELQRRLDAVVAMLEPGDKPNCMESKYNPAGRVSIYDADRMVYDARHRDHARAVAIAEGRDNG